MKINDTSLKDFNQLAYEFAIRNKIVVTLLRFPPHVSSKMLLTFGIDTKAHFTGSEGVEIETDSYDELYLHYNHLESVRQQFGITDDVDMETKKVYCRRIIHPNSKNKLLRQENPEIALKRIRALIETRGRSGGRLERLINGEAFEHYDKTIFDDLIPYQIDDTSNSNKTIVSDVAFIKEWIQPEKYLQLIPRYSFSF